MNMDSRVEEIIKNILDDAHYKGEPQSRLEDLLIDLGEKIGKISGDPEAVKKAVDEYLKNNPVKVSVSKAEGNAISEKPDGLYCKSNLASDIYHVTGERDYDITPGGGGHSVTAEELWNAGVTGGTYLIACHSNTSMSQMFFIGFLDMWLDASETPHINDMTVSCITNNPAGRMGYGTYNGVERLFYEGGDEGSICSMSFVKLSSYVDN